MGQLQRMGGKGGVDKFDIAIAVPTRNILILKK
jgi:hypothetical protein